MRAARNEIFGPDERPPTGVDDKDLTSSRLQSELYREYHVVVVRDSANCSVRRVPGAATLLFPLQPYAIHCPGTATHQRLPVRQRESFR
jgi:hypothetical protein